MHAIVIFILLIRKALCLKKKKPEFKFITNLANEIMAFVDEEMINFVSRFPFKPRFRVEIK